MRCKNWYIMVALLVGLPAQGLVSSAYATSIEQSVQAALGQSPALEAQRLDYVKTRQAIDIARGNNDLTGNFSLTGADINEERPARSSHDQRITGTVSLSKQLYDFGEVDARVASAEDSLRASQARYDAAEQRLIFDVISAHLQVITAEQTLKIRKNNVERLKAHTQAARIRLENGSSTPTRVADAEARLARAQSDLIQAETDLISAQDAYLSLTALPANGLTRPQMPSGLPEALGDAEERALTQHPSIRSADLSVQAAQHEFEVLRKSILPKIKLGLSYSQQNQQGTAADKDTFTTSIELKTPFLVTDAVKAKDREIAAKTKQAKFNRDDTRRIVGLNVRKAFRDYRAARAQRKAVALEYEAAKLLNEGTGSEVEFGLKTFLDQLDTEQTLSDVDLRQFRTEQSVLTSAFSLLLNMGELSAENLALDTNLPPLDLISDPQSRYTLPVPIAIAD